MARFNPPLVLPERPDLSFEEALWRQGYRFVAGIDEVGRGALAGPVAAGMVILPPDPALFTQLKGVRDSKQMKPDERGVWAEEIKQIAAAWGVGYASNQEIDEMGILAATRLAVMRAMQKAAIQPEHLLVDYLQLPDTPLPQIPLVKGDNRSLSIAAASVVAKTQRDALMETLDVEFPGYGFSSHKGYGTARHRQALLSQGPCRVHRLSFSLVR